MRTNQLMTRDSIINVQRTKDSFFNATAILNEWNGNNPSKKKLMSEYNKLKSTIEFVDYLKKHEGVENPLQVSTKGTWMHYKVFVDFAMWISLEFKSLALEWVFDGLIKARTDAGDYYKEMCLTIMDTYINVNGCKPPSMLYINEAKMIKEIASLEIERNKMSEKDLSRLTTLQKVNATLIKRNIGKESRKKHLTIVNESLII